MDAEVTDSYSGGSGEPLVLVHGINASWRVWRPVLPLLEADHAIWAPTLAGHRGGPALVDDSGITALADDLERRMDERGLGRVRLAGNSLGGWVGFELARRGRVTSLVALSPAGSWTSARDLRRLGLLMRGARRFGTGAVARRLVKRPRLRRVVLRSAFERADQIPTAEALAMVDDLAACTALDSVLAAAHRDGPSHTGAGVPADCAVRIAWGQRDRTIPFTRYGAGYVAAIAHAELVMMPGVGHVPMYDDPALVARTITEFSTVQR